MIIIRVAFAVLAFFRPIVGAVLDKVVGPDVIAVLGPQPDGMIHPKARAGRA